MSTPLTNHKKIALLILGLVIIAVGVFGAWHGVGVAYAIIDKIGHA